MPKSTIWSTGTINGADTLTVGLIEPPGMPAAILLMWPQKPSITTPDAYSNVAAACMQVLSAAVIELAAIRTRRGL